MALILLNYSRRSFLMRERPFFKSFTDDDSLIPFPVNSLTKRNRDRKNVQTKYQPVMRNYYVIFRQNNNNIKYINYIH